MIMANTSIDPAALELLLAPLLAQEGVELVDLQILHESGRRVLRFFLDKERGITLDDCAVLSDRIGAMLDENNTVPGAYVLEVSSPGLDRVLKKEKDFLRFAGRGVKIRLKAPLAGRRNFTGRLEGFEQGQAVITAGSETYRFLPEEIAEARLEIEVKL